MSNQIIQYSDPAYAIQVQKENEVRALFRSEDTLGMFKQALGDQGGSYAIEVMYAVLNNKTLLTCDMSSVMQCAFRAASLRLSCDQSTGHAYIVPFQGKATLIVGYKGMVTMAERTGRYRYINVSPIYIGESVVEDRITGGMSITGKRESEKVAGWLAYFELWTGFAKSLYMSVEEIHAHAKQYNPNG